MKIKLSTLLIVLILLVVSIADSENQDRNKVLVLGVRSDAPPFSSFDKKNELPEQAVGYTVELCNRIADRAVYEGLYCTKEYVEVNTAGRFDDLKSGKINMLCGASTVTLERMRVADFSLFTFLSGASVMYREKNIRNRVEMNEPFRVGVLKSTTTELEVKRIIQELQKTNSDFNMPASGKIEVLPVDYHYQGLEKLNEGSIEAYVADREILLALKQNSIEESENSDIVVSDDYYTAEPYAIGIEIGNSELRYIANRVLSELYHWDQSGDQKENIFTVLSNNFPKKRFSKHLETLFRFQRITGGEQILGPVERANCR